MSDLIFLSKAIIVGFSMAAPVGPVGLLCIKKTLSDGKRAGIIAGLGAATADAIYGSIAALSITAISSFLLDHQTTLLVIGSLFLIYLAVNIFRSKPRNENNSVNGSPVKSYISTFFITLTNPTTIIYFAVVFAGLGVATNTNNYLGSGLVVVGIFLGSALWWVILCSGVELFKHKLDAKRLIWVDKISGVLIAILALFFLFGVNF